MDDDLILCGSELNIPLTSCASCMKIDLVIVLLVAMELVFRPNGLLVGEVQEMSHFRVLGSL